MTGRKKRPRRPTRTTTTTTTTPAPATGWVLTFEDDFTGSALDPQRWETQYPWGRDRSKTGELQWYGEGAFALSGSVLKLLATEGGPAGFRYTSGMISTHASFAQVYGRFEIRCRVPAGTGLWPAFWLLPVSTDWPPEIDIMEIIGSEPNVAHMTYHYDDNGVNKSNGTAWPGPNFSSVMHAFALEWEADRLVWFIDGTERHRVEGVTPRVPMYILCNLAVGGNWPGPPDATTPFPAAFEIDYVRAWKRGEGA